MSVAFFTHVSDDWFNPVGADRLIASAKYFHPNIPFFVFGSDYINEIFKTYGTKWDILIPFFGKKVGERYDLAIHIDADSCFVDNINEVFEMDFEIASVRDCRDILFNKINKIKNLNQPIMRKKRLEKLKKPYIIDKIYFPNYLNAGFIASRNKNFWTHWIKDNLKTAHNYNCWEQDVMNKIFYSGAYKGVMLDPVEKDVYYGISANYNDGKNYLDTKKSWDSWKKIEIKEGKLYLHNRLIKILHEAGGHYLPKMQLNNFSGPVRDYINKITFVKSQANNWDEIKIL